MFSKEKSQQIQDQEQQDCDTLVGFFNLLLKVDMRTNPELYEKPETETYDWHHCPHYPKRKLHNYLKPDSG